jgi:thiol-disulfide isomerase/thioredoxin
MQRLKQILAIILLLIIDYQSKAQHIKSIEGLPFPDEVLSSILYTTKGDSTTLGNVITDLHGKNILIDFWASWCKACLVESEYTKKIQQDYKDKQIVFLFLSTDTDYKQWLRGLSEINIDGNHYRIKPQSKKNIQNYLKIKGIPYYVLMDKNGKIYDAKAPWPHLQKMRDEINMLLNISNE